MKKIFYFICISMLFSCKEEKKDEPILKWNNDKSSEMHKNFAAEEQIDIQLFKERDNSEDYKTTGTGLHYKIVDSTKNERIVSGNIVEAKLRISLLDGTLCYETPEELVDEINVDKSDIETGVQEGVKLLREGEKARMIIPSYLAHGLVGDLDKIPPLSTIVVDITIIRVY